MFDRIGPDPDYAGPDRDRAGQRLDKDRGQGQRMAVIRRELRIARPADEVWPAIGDPAALPGWFPGIVAAQVDGSSRVITTASGICLPEEIVTNDPVRRVFQYKITAPLLSNHLGTIEVTDADDGCCLVSYQTSCEPDTIALVIGGACGNALHELRRQLESQPDVPSPAQLQAQPPAQSGSSPTTEA